MSDKSISVHELEDRRDKVYVFGFPEDAQEGSVASVAQAIDQRLDHAEVLLFAGSVDSDMVIGELEEDELTFVGIECPECESQEWRKEDDGFVCTDCGFLDSEGAAV